MATLRNMPNGIERSSYFAMPIVSGRTARAALERVPCGVLSMVWAALFRKALEVEQGCVLSSSKQLSQVPHRTHLSLSSVHPSISFCPAPQGRSEQPASAPTSTEDVCAAMPDCASRRGGRQGGPDPSSCLSLEGGMELIM